MPFGFLHSITDFFTPKPVSLREKNTVGKLIEAVNDCGEKRYIEVAAERNYHQERQQDLEILLTKCKRLLSFVERTDDVQVFEEMALFIVKVRQAKYRGDDIHNLIEEFEKIEKSVKKGSKSFKNLSHVMMG